MSTNDEVEARLAKALKEEEEAIKKAAEKAAAAARKQAEGS